MKANENVPLPRRPLRELHLFAGAGGGVLGGILLGHTCVCAVEIDPYCRKVLLQRQRDGILPRFAVWDDILTFDARPWRGRVDVVCGGFPCQDISATGKGAGISGKRSGLWSEMFRVVCEVEPKIVLVENSPMLTVRGLGRVLGDLASVGYDAQWGVLGAGHAGAPHERERIWILAYSNQFGGHENSSYRQLWASRAEQSSQNQGRSHSPRNGQEQEVSHSNGAHGEGGWVSSGVHEKLPNAHFPGSWWEADPADAAESPMGRVAHGVANRLDRLRAIGNGQVSRVVELAWETLMARALTNASPEADPPST